MIEDDREEEVTIVLTKVEAAMLFDKARMSRSAWEEFAVQDKTRSDLPEQHRGHSAERAEKWRRLEDKLSEAVGGNPGLKRIKKLEGVRNL